MTNSKVAFSTNHGSTLGTPVTVGTSPATIGGFDINRIGNTNIAAQSAKTRSATTQGGAYADTTGGGTAGADPITVYIPRMKFGGTTTNANLASPDFLLAASALVAAEALWKVSGGAQTAITPSVTGTKALAFSENAANMGYVNGNIIAYLGQISGTTHLFYSSNGGTGWSDRGSLAGSLYVRIRASDRRTIPALYICGGTILKYSIDGGATLQSRTPPVGSGLLGIEVLA